jgi:RNA polymerase sigma factor (sigma-70 family)
VLILEHLDKVAAVAGLLRRKLPPQFEFRELAQVGILAMLEAAPRWDPKTGEFWPFVYLRVRGAMLDFAAGFSIRIATKGPESIPAPDSDISLRIDLERAMRKLTFRQQRVLWALQHGDQAREIAATLEITEAAVSQIRKRIRELLRSQFVV